MNANPLKNQTFFNGQNQLLTTRKAANLVRFSDKKNLREILISCPFETTLTMPN